MANRRRELLETKRYGISSIDYYQADKLGQLTIYGYVRELKLSLKLNIIPIDIINIIMKFYSIFLCSLDLTDKDLMISDNIMINNSNPYSQRRWKHLYDANEYDKGRYEWTIIILNEKYTRINMNHWTIGIVDASKIAHPHFGGYFPYNYGLGYNSDGSFYYTDTMNGKVGNQQYGQRYGLGDVITTIVDLSRSLF